MKLLQLERLRKGMRHVSDDSASSWTVRVRAHLTGIIHALKLTDDSLSGRLSLSRSESLHLKVLFLSSIRQCAAPSRPRCKYPKLAV